MTMVAYLIAAYLIGRPPSPTAATLSRAVSSSLLARTSDQEIERSPR